MALGGTLALIIGLAYSALLYAEEEAIDEMIVESAPRPAQIRAELQRVELQIYSLFNDLNDDDGYDIICREVRPIGSQILQRQCKARMLFEAEAESAVDAGNATAVWHIEARAAEHEERLTELLRDAAEESPELLEMLVERRRLMNQLSEAKGETGDGG